MKKIDNIISYIKKTGHNPYSDEKLCKGDIFYINTLYNHYETLSDELYSVIKNNNINSLLELGSYMAVGSHLAQEAGISNITCSDMWELADDSSYKKWLKEKDSNYQHFDLTKEPKNEFLNKYDCIIFQETLEHIPYNPARVLINVNKMLKDNGILIFSVPNFYSVRSIINLMKFSHPYVKKEELLDLDSPTEKSGIHWIEFNSKLIKNIIEFCNFNIVSYKGNNIKYGSSIKYKIKNLIKFIIPPLFDQHRFVLKKDKCFETYLKNRKKITSEHEALNL